MNLQQKNFKLPDWLQILSSPALWFVVVVLCELATSLAMIGGHRIPRGHDMYSYFPTQFFYLNNAVTAGQIPQWLPYITHGTLGTWFWYLLQAGFLQNALCLFPFLLFKTTNFIPVYYAGFFADALILLVGTWRLAGRFSLSLPATVLVALSVTGSCIWIDQPWFNYHFFYAVPLTLDFLHEFLEKGRWRYLLFAGNLAAMQMLGNLAYLFSAFCLSIFLYFVFRFVTEPKNFIARLSKIPRNRNMVISLCLVLLSFATVYLLIKTGGRDMVFYRAGRDPNTGIVPLKGFLTNTANLNLSFWLEQITGNSPCIDQTYYWGIVASLFIVPAILLRWRDKNFIPFLATGIILLLFGITKTVPAFFYYTWPGMKYFRYIGMALPLSRIFLIFCAGFGFDALLRKDPLSGRPGISRVLLGGWAFVPLGLAVFLLLSSPITPLGAQWQSAWPKGEYYCAYLMSDCTNPVKIFRSLLSAAAVFSTLLFFAAIFFKKTRAAAALPYLILLFHAADLTSYKISQFTFRTRALEEHQYRLFDFQPMPYDRRRSVFFFDENPRARILFPQAYFDDQLADYWFRQATELDQAGSDAYFGTRLFPRLTRYGSEFQSVALLFFEDQLGSSFNIEYWLRPFDRLLRAYYRVPLDEKEVTWYAAQINGGILAPLEPSFRKVAGATEDKIQFFAKAYRSSSEDAVGDWLSNPDYSGDILFVTGQTPSSQDSFKAHTEEISARPDLGGNDRIRLPYEVKKFDANHMELSVRLADMDSAWLYYCDVWHPYWQAIVNGETAKIERANLAYKAVALKRGVNNIRFHFHHPVIVWLHRFFGINSLVWLIFIFFQTAKLAGLKLSNFPWKNRSSWARPREPEPSVHG